MKLAPEAQLYLQLRASLNLPDLRTLSPDEGRRISEETSRRWQLSDPPAVESVEQRSCDGPNGPVSLRIYRPTRSPNERMPCLVFYHGGGWVLGSLDGWMASAGRFAMRLNLCDFSRLPSGSRASISNWG